GLRFHDPPGAKLHGLDVGRCPRRFQSTAFKLAGDIVGGPAMALAAGFAPFEIVIGEKQHVRPPAFGLRRMGRPVQRGRRSQRDGAAQAGHFLPFTFLYSARMACNWRAWLSAWPAYPASRLRSDMGPFSVCWPMRSNALSGRSFSSS